ncbi:dihydrofolate reductase family protein [Nocardia flavorosea]|uniref:dihydrofolate reductase family protein n=1 Tax=Nocardia flavorosea TaxID=53429 RepID=UPI001894AD1A|nr:dihydrofolate reductase family protein [Nocardia flavorosea]MBF6351631.1 dihydrofolate reductase family protein [Nocardia flavorosea]
MKLVLTEFLTLDGVTQGPGAPDEDISDGFTRGGWMVPYLDEVFVRRTSEWLDAADGLLFGRRTYTAFARDWPAVTDPRDPFAGRMNALPKYVVSGTLATGIWAPTTVLPGDPVATVADLLRRPGRELQVHGSSRLGDTLLAAGLVETVRLAVAPTVLRSGRRLLAGAGPATALRLTRHEATDLGLLLLEYDVVGAAPLAEYDGVTQFL